MESKIRIFLVDDDELFLKSLELKFMAEADFEIETFVSGEECIKSLGNTPDVIILDYHLDGIDKNAMNGIEVLDKILELKSEIPVVMLSSQDKIEVAIMCMHHKAFDYVVKSETAFVRLQKIITRIFDMRKMEKTLNWYIDRA
ncbi:MAG: response regulator [Bacteroidia bacterium]|jgi:DNA-binding NtrC family response regulator|nr:response regulator [Bacteroidota bacterium]MBP9923297.1 response regulator [Bacteroidia bacterium]